MEVNDLTDEQIANLTPEQVTLLENEPDKVAEILADQAANTKDKPEPAVKDSVANDAGDEEGEPVVLNKSGRVIPYVEYKEMRVDNARLREELAEVKAQQQAAAKLQELKQEKAEARTPEALAEAEEAISAHMETFKVDMPELYEVVNHTLGENKRLTAQVERIEALLAASDEKIARQREQDLNEQATEARENSPQLMHWQNHDESAWNEALRQDGLLMETPEWKNRPIPERFEEVIRRVRAIDPQASLPPTLTAAEQARAATKAKLEQAPLRKPTTLSDIQGGANPTSESEQISNLPALDLVGKYVLMNSQKAAALRADLD
jgi:hypothetical protein